MSTDDIHNCNKGSQTGKTSRGSTPVARGYRRSEHSARGITSLIWLLVFDEQSCSRGPHRNLSGSRQAARPLELSNQDDWFVLSRATTGNAISLVYNKHPHLLLVGCLQVVHNLVGRLQLLLQLVDLLLTSTTSPASQIKRRLAGTMVTRSVLKG